MKDSLVETCSESSNHLFSNYIHFGCLYAKSRILAGFVLFIYIIGGVPLLKAQQPNVKFPVTIETDTGESQKLELGLDPSAADGIDPEFGEEELPPIRPSGFFARLVDDDIEATGLGLGVERDIRQGSSDFSGSVVHEVRYRPGDEASEVSISWDLPKGVTGSLEDVATGGDEVSKQMEGEGSSSLSNLELRKLTITLDYSGDVNQPPTELQATAGDGRVDLTWSANGDSNSTNYNVYRSTSSFSDISGATQVNSSLVSSTDFSDTEVTNDTQYFYRVTAVDSAGNESSLSEEVSAVPSAGSDQLAGTIVFTSTRDGNREIYKTDGDGSDQVRLTNNTASDRHPAISPDGQEIVFLSDRIGELELFKMNIDGSEVTQLTDDIPATQSSARGVDWSPDGEEIIFAIKNSGVIQLYRADSDGSNVSQLVSETFTEPCMGS